MIIFFTNENGFKTYFALKDFECLTENYLWIKSENAPRFLINELQYYELATQLEKLLDLNKMDRLPVLEQVIQNMNEAIKELKAEIEALKAELEDKEI